MDTSNDFIFKEVLYSLYNARTYNFVHLLKNNNYCFKFSNRTQTVVVLFFTKD